MSDLSKLNVGDYIKVEIKEDDKIENTVEAMGKIVDIRRYGGNTVITINNEIIQGFYFTS